MTPSEQAVAEERDLCAHEANLVYLRDVENERRLTGQCNTLRLMECKAKQAVALEIAALIRARGE